MVLGQEKSILIEEKAMTLKPVKVKRKFLKSEVTREEVEQEKARQESVGGQCTLTDEGDFWVLFCTFF